MSYAQFIETPATFDDDRMDIEDDSDPSFSSDASDDCVLVTSSAPSRPPIEIASPVASFTQPPSPTISSNTRGRGRARRGSVRY